jgi:hypothetical protein
VGRNRVAGDPTPGNAGNRAAACSTVGAVVARHGIHTVEHRGISQRAVTLAGFGV